MSKKKKKHEEPMQAECTESKEECEESKEEACAESHEEACTESHEEACEESKEEEKVDAAVY